MREALKGSLFVKNDMEKAYLHFRNVSEPSLQNYPKMMVIDMQDIPWDFFPSERFPNFPEVSHFPLAFRSRLQ